jgi:hypothetical protein
MKEDDWRGLDRIRIGKRSTKEIKDEENSLLQRFAHRRRRAHGVGQSRSGGLWARQIRSWTISANIKGGME